MMVVAVVDKSCCAEATTTAVLAGTPRLSGSRPMPIGKRATVLTFRVISLACEMDATQARECFCCRIVVVAVVVVPQSSIDDPSSNRFFCNWLFCFLQRSPRDRQKKRKTSKKISWKRDCDEQTQRAVEAAKQSNRKRNNIAARSYLTHSRHHGK